MIRRFGRFELDEERFELRRSGRAVELEPRAFELLAYLARHPRRVVSKDELVREVWRGKFVTDAAVTYAVGAARRALLEPAAEAELAPGSAGTVRLATVHGRGYRLETDVDCGGLPDPPSAPSAEPQPVPAVDPASRFGPGHRPLWSPGRRVGATLALGGLAAVALFALTRTLSRPGVEAQASAATRAALVLAEPEAPEGDVELHLLAVSLIDSLRARLGQVTGLTILEAEVAGSAPDAPRVLLALDRDTGDDHAHLQAFLVDPRPVGGPRRTPLERVDLPLLSSSRDLARFNHLRDRLAARLVAAVLPVVELAPGGPGLSPRDPEAYRLYLLALERSESVSCDNRAFVSLLRDSLARDPQFAPAWEVLGWAEYGLVAYCGGEASHYAAALAAADRALALAPTWTPALLLRISVLAETDRWPEAWRAVAASRQAGGDPATLAFARSYLLTYMGELAAGRTELEASLAADPLLLSASSWVPNALLYSGEVDRYLDLLPGPTSPFMRYFRAEALLRLDRPAEAVEVLRPAFGSNPGDQAARLAEALLQLVEGRRDTAVTILRALDEQRRRLGTGDGEVSFRLASLFARAGDGESALRSLARAVEQGFLCHPAFAREPGLSTLAGEPRFADLVEKARERARELLAAAGQPTAP